MQVYDKNMRNITILFHQNSKVISHKDAKKKCCTYPTYTAEYIQYKQYVYHLRLNVLLYNCIRKGSWSLNEHKKKYRINIKSGSYPCTGLDRPLGLQEVEARRISRHEGGKVIRPTHRLPLPPRRYPLYSFLLQAESTPGQQCGRYRTRDLPACSAVPKSPYRMNVLFYSTEFPTILGIMQYKPDVSNFKLFVQCILSTYEMKKPTDVTISILFIYRRISACFGPTRPSSGEFTQLITQPLVQWPYRSGRVLCMLWLVLVTVLYSRYMNKIEIVTSVGFSFHITDVSSSDFCLGVRCGRHCLLYTNQNRNQPHTKSWTSVLQQIH
jgi:hypothetical protein